ncbi:uncharacterized protein EDB91DRAFT_236106 [Suillus paluster]|uniref:uncharacterized protein n=1 Tax=Suillus paluster TaxID=48578 RepID=UPI001B87F3D0|nr:uncharacterized protein EDB91DRAFT_236106 [Suillus paluster]KAG1743230.1 hypothetical protein EDB91DRAFT_236106 [Suillus paluster]
MGQQISSDDGARTRVLYEETCSRRSRSVPPESTMSNSVHTEPASGSQSHIAHQTAGKRSSTEPRKFGEIISQFTAPLALSLVLENKGNVARDHLASERTYLAYVRTSLACASAGVALVQLFTLSSSTNVNVRQGGIDPQRFARPLGATVVLLGLFILIYGLVRYFMTQAALVRGFFPVARNSVTVVAFSLGAIVGIVFGVLVAGTGD